MSECKYRNACGLPMCDERHPDNRRPKRQCRYRNDCTRNDCYFGHTDNRDNRRECIYGDACKYGSMCIFKHEDSEHVSSAEARPDVAIEVKVNADPELDAETDLDAEADPDAEAHSEDEYEADSDDEITPFGDGQFRVGDGPYGPLSRERRRRDTSDDEDDRCYGCHSGQTDCTSSSWDWDQYWADKGYNRIEMVPLCPDCCHACGRCSTVNP
jgi:hypothetical protein